MSAPEKIGPYRVVAELGRGGMGVVYRGETDDGQVAAIKVMLPAGANAARRFAREASINIHHRNVVEVLGSGETADGSPYIAFEMLEGHSLDRALATRDFTAKEVVDVAKQICQGLRAAHGAGVIHRDLKPGNVFLCDDGTVKILDFGIAYVNVEATRVTNAGTVLGTPAYLSPEQAHGAADIDERSDIWSLGAIVYEMLAGRAPFVRDSVVAVLLAVVMDELVPLREYVPEISPQLAAVVERALAKDRNERWPDAESFGAALSRSSLRAKPSDTIVDIDTDLRSSVLFRDEESRVVSLLFAEVLEDRVAFEEILRNHGGRSVLLLNGNAIGIFGADRWEGDEPLRAASAALAVAGIAPRVGLASGRGVASRGSITGAVVEAARTACRAAADGSVLIDRVTASALAGRFDLADAGDSHARLIERRRRERSHEIPFIGRRLERRQLELAIDTVVEEERSVVVYVTGPAGIGKTRIVEEFVGITRRDSVELQVLRATAESSHRSRSLWVISEMVRDLLDREVHAEVVGAGEVAALRSYLSSLEVDDAQLETMAIGLAQTFETGSVDIANSDQLDPVLVADQVFLAFESYLRACLTTGPLAVVIDDWQWADRQSRDLIVKLQQQLGSFPVLFVIAERDSGNVEGGDDFSEADMLRLSLRGFARKETKALVEAVLGSELSSDIVDTMLVKTEGNPLFIEQLAATMSGPHGTMAEGAVALPINVEAAIQSRLDRLSSAGKKMCKLLSAFQRPVMDAELFAIGAKDVATAVQELIHQGIVEDRSRDRSGVWFRSPLVAEVAYRLLSEENRLEIHRRIAGMLRQNKADAEEIARHLERGMRPNEAGPFYALAARGAASRGDSVSVISCGEKASALGCGSCEVHLLIAEAHGHMGDRTAQAEALARASDSQVSLRDDVAVHTAQAIWEWRMGKLDEALETGARAIASAERLGDHQLLCSAIGWHAVALAYGGRISAAQEAADKAHSYAGKDVGRLALACHWRGLVAACAGDLGTRLKAFEEAAGLYHKAGNLRRAVGAEINLADAYNRAGAYEEAKNALDTCIEGCDRLRIETLQGYALTNLARAQVGIGEVSEALAVLDRAHEIARKHGDLRLQSASLLYRAKAHLSRDHMDDAARTATESIDRARECKQPGLEAQALALRGRAKLALGDTEGALADSAASMAIRDRLGGLEEDEIEVFVVRAQALERAGQSDDAWRVREQGRERLKSLALQIGDSLWRERFLNAVPAHRDILGS